ncbi:ATP-grasp fold, subdomain 2 [Haemophilus parainfluenzae]|uniref:ATP-grasp fold, subdomain 2 n=1 Tax=Haemophilus parainfluenzae TaxID=729 RepID=UPI001E36E5EE|nr:ATP-grasp fold, subdomain 2 [Haemophilus parainfluenzae]
MIGTKHNPQWLNTPFSQLHWYGKEVRPGRKLGHINITHPDKTIIIQQLEKLRHELPLTINPGLNWAIEN